jgi:putative transposase
MALRKVSFVVDEYYHIYNRGNSKQSIFHDDEDRIRFIELLFLSNASNSFNMKDLKKVRDIFEHNRGVAIVAIGAYVLMDNHFHILVRQVDEGNISKFMQKLTTGYSMYYNRKYKRTGGLFEGKFKAQHISSDRYLKYMFSYIHLNPLKLIEPKWKKEGVKNSKKAFQYIENFRWSSYRDFLGERYKRSVGVVLQRNSFPEYFSSPETMRKELFDWIHLS